MIEVRKMRSSRVWRSGNRRALVERSVLTVPERLVSVSLESWPEDNGAEYGNREPEDRQCLLSAISELRLIDLGFKEMNYLEAVEKWATGADSILS